MANLRLNLPTAGGARKSLNEIRMRTRYLLDRNRPHRFVLLLATACGLVGCVLSSDSRSIGSLSSGNAGAVSSDVKRLATPSGEKTIGLVLSGFDYLIYGSDDGKEECPSGLVHSSVENWRAQFPTVEARKAHYARCAGIDNRGPDCENVLIAPDSVDDPLPYREVQGSKSFGKNLDRNEDGKATSTTCAHENFSHPDGAKGIDNQFYRLVGCQRIVRGGGLFSPSAGKTNSNARLLAYRHLRILMEISEVDNELNDDHVKVSIYQSRDPLTVGAENNAIPWQSHRVDPAIPAQRLEGKIVNGELVTKPADVRFPEAHISAFGYILVRGASFSLKLSENGAEGLRTGYIDAASWWRARRIAIAAGIVAGDSPPALYRALNRLADGYKDPKSRQCTALSSALKLEFVKAYVLHPSVRGGA